MARKAIIIGKAADIWGDEWNIRETRPAAAHGLDVHLGWPAGAARGRGGIGGPRVIVTVALAEHFGRYRDQRGARGGGRLDLPIGISAIKRVRALLGHHYQIDVASWWEDRADDLADLSIDAFMTQHGVSAGSVANARHALFGKQLRQAGWWREQDTVEIILADAPRALIAERLGISVGSVGRLRWVLRLAK